jgi:hypothetical protein
MVNDTRLASWLPLFEDTCPDVGLDAYATLPEATKWLPRTVIWVGIALAIDQTVAAAIAATRLPRASQRLRMRLLPAFVLPSALVLLWTFLTALSIVMVGLTFRSSAALLIKSLHVVTEAGFLVAVFLEFGFEGLAAITITLVTCVLSMVFTLPCAQMVQYAQLGGLSVDYINFGLLALYGLSVPDDPVLWTLIGGFGWHALYLLTYIVMRRLDVSPLGLVWVRVAGMAFNNIANEFMLHAVRLAGPERAASGWMRREDWLAASDEPAILWCDGRMWLRGASGDGVVVQAHAPGLTAYAVGDAWRAWRAFAAGSVALVRATSSRTATATPWLLLPPRAPRYRSIRRASDAPCERVLVVPRRAVRAVRSTGLLAVGLVLASFA